MNVCYLWVEKYCQLKNFEISFSKTDNFKMSSKSDVLSKTECQKIPTNLYNEGVSSMSAIIGESDKTTSLQLICNFLKAPDFFKTNYVIVYEKEGTLYQISNKEIEFDFTVNVGCLSDFDELDVIYYSHKLEQRELNLHHLIKDLSITSFVNNEYIPEPMKEKLEIQKEFVDSEYFNLDLKSKIKFVKNNGKGYWKNIKPSELIYLNLLAMILKSYENDESRKNTVICIDELDSGMSLQEQVKLLKTVTDKVVDLIGKKVQFVLTTNSLQVLSDLPSYVIKSTDEIENMKMFHANVHDIFKTIVGTTNLSGAISNKFVENILDLMDKSDSEITNDEYKILKEANNFIENDLIQFHLNKRVEELRNKF